MYLFLSFLLPIFIVLLCYIVKGYSFSAIKNLPDVEQQYIPLLKYFNGVLLSDNSIFYSFSKSLGGSMFSTYFYYLSSPLNIICLFFSCVSYKIIFILIIIKIGLCGMTMYIFLNNKFDNGFNCCLFSLCYSLMGYNILYSNNIMWLDVVFLTPIVILDIDLLVNKNDCFLFLISLVFAIWCNFYIAFSLCIFSTIYLFYNLFIVIYIDKKMIIKKFFISSFFVVCLCAFFLIPIFCELSNFKDRFLLNEIISYDINNVPLLLYKVCLVLVLFLFILL